MSLVKETILMRTICLKNSLENEKAGTTCENIIIPQYCVAGKE